MELILNRDAWSSGQIGSKLWLCSQVETLWPKENLTVWVLGGWYGVLSHLLLTRERLQIDKIRSFDIDPNCEAYADALNEHYVWQAWKFKAYTVDVNQLNFVDSIYSSQPPQVVINTAVEHFSSFDWWDRIPQGTRVVIQSTDMKHKDHLFLSTRCEDLLERFPFREVHYSGEIFFDYGNSSSFKRFMVIGQK